MRAPLAVEVRRLGRNADVVDERRDDRLVPELRDPGAHFSGGTNPEAVSAPVPKKCCSVCSMRYLRARASARFRRFSLTSIVCCLSHCAHASFDTFSQIRLPSSPGYGGNCRPSASRPSLTHFTILGIGGLYEGWRGGSPLLDALQKHLRATAPVVERLTLRRQRLDFHRPEALLEEPVRRVGGEGEDLAQLLRLVTLLARPQQPLTVARFPIVGRYREASEFSA